MPIKNKSTKETGCVLAEVMSMYVCMYVQEYGCLVVSKRGLVVT